MEGIRMITLPGLKGMKKIIQNILLSLTLILAASVSHAVEKVTYFHLDALGSPVVATNESGEVIWREDFKPYGEKLINDEAARDNNQWYTGKPHDDDTGLTYFGARYYDPVIGRFMGMDAVGVKEGNHHSFNRYAYANNNPYRFVDPDGNFAILATNSSST